MNGKSEGNRGGGNGKGGKGLYYAAAHDANPEQASGGTPEDQNGEELLTGAAYSLVKELPLAPLAPPHRRRRDRPADLLSTGLRRQFILSPRRGGGARVAAAVRGHCESQQGPVRWHMVWGARQAYFVAERPEMLRRLRVLRSQGSSRCPRCRAFATRNSSAGDDVR